MPRRGVDKFMGRLGNPLAVVGTEGIRWSTITVIARKSPPTNQDHEIEFELIHQDLGAVLELLAHERVQTTRGGRGK